MKTLKSLATAAALITTISASTAALAIDEYNVSTGTTVDGHGVAVRGNDVVALSTGLDVVPGQARFTQVHDGVAYYFASEETKERFAKAPEKFIPQYGGFCALGVALGKKLDAAPRYADIVDGRLYVFLNEAVFEKYQEDKAGILAKAEKNWPAMRNVAVSQVNS